MFDIDNHDKEILAVGYENKTIEYKYKLNQLNIVDMKSLLGTNSRLEEKNQCINDFSIGYTMNPNLHKNKAFNEQVKGLLKNTFGPSTNIHIGKILLKKYKSVSIGYILWEWGEIISKLFRVLSCVIDTIIDKYVCIDYLGSEKSNLSYLKIGCTGSSKHDGMDYNNLLGIGITNLLWIFLSCYGFSKTTNLLSY